MKVLNEYPGSHHYFEDYEQTDWFCPNCGSKGTVWEATCGDYYVGGRSICTACNHQGQLLGGMSLIKDANVQGQADQLKSGQAKKPTTKRGG